MWSAVVFPSRMALLGAALGVVAACAREDEAAMRARVERWFSLGPTLAFAARGDCAAGAYRLASAEIKSAMPVAGSVEEMLLVLDREGRAALDYAEQAPDKALVELANAERATGMKMRRIGLEARACMDADTEGGFRAALLRPGAVIAFDRESGTVMVMDTEAGRLFAVMGAE